MSHEDFTAELQAQPMGWRAQELAGNGPAPVVIRNAVKIGSRRRPTGIYAEIAIIPERDGKPAVLTITNQYSGHGEAYELPDGLTLLPVEEQARPDMIVVRSPYGWSLRVNNSRPLDEALISSADSLASLLSYADTLEGSYTIEGQEA